VHVITWIRPNFGLVALNVNNNAFLESNLGGFGGLIRDNTRCFLHGFLDNISRPYILHVEILGLYHGLKLCLDSCYKQVLYLSYSGTVVDLIQKGLNMFHKYENLIWAIKQLFLKDWVINLQHILREDNDAADFLANKGALIDSYFVVFHSEAHLTFHVFS